MASAVFLNNTPIELTFGLYTEKHEFNKQRGTQSLAFMHNVFNIVDWVPIIGIISGIARCIIAASLTIYYKNELCEDGERASTVKQWMILEGARGVISTLGLGLLFCIPDLLFYFNYSAKMCKDQ